MDMRNNQVGLEGKQRGQQAEERFLSLASRSGFDARKATAQEDGAKKADVIVDGRPFQVSSTPKSKGEQKRLERRGVYSVAAGSHVPDSAIVAFLKSVFGL